MGDRIQTTAELVERLKQHGRPLRSFRKGDRIQVSNRMVKNAWYTLSESPGTNFAADFRPALSPAEMLRLGVFEGKYLNDCTSEFPAEWFLDAIALEKLSPAAPNTLANLFQEKSRQPLSVWKDNGWAPASTHMKSPQHPILSDPSTNPDERGWFQWYCRYWMGRRLPELDAVQIERWRAFARHAGQIRANCKPGDLTCRPRQRQALLQWAYNPFL